MKQMKMETKQAKSRQGTQKQELTPNYLHLCTRKKGARMRGQHRERQRTIKTNRKREKKNKHHLQVGDEACTFYQGSKQRTECISEHKGKSQRVPRGMPCLQSCLLRAISEQPGEEHSLCQGWLREGQNLPKEESLLGHGSWKGSQTSGITIASELIRNANYWVPLHSYCIRNSWGWAQQSVSPSPAGNSSQRTTALGKTSSSARAH